MALSTSGLTAIALISALALAGCQGSRMASVDPLPAPLPAAPAGTVEGKTLPPPATPDNFPDAPQEEKVAALPATPPAGAPDVTTGSVTGVWNAEVGGQSCKIATSLTKRGSNNRAAPLRCAAPADGIAAWNVAGKQLTFYDGNGETLARLYSSGGERFDGQTQSGQPISLTR